MHTTLVYEAEKAIIEERIRHAALAQHQPLSPRRTTVRGPERHPRHARLRAVVGLLALIGGAGLTFASSALADVPEDCAAGRHAVTCGYQYTGSEQTFTVPSGVDSVQVYAVGAAVGGIHSTLGGAAATATAALAVWSGEVLYVEVGGAGRQVPGPGPGGWNGGGTGGGGAGGGGASDVRTIPCGPTCPGNAASLGSRAVVAAGGGGAGAGPFSRGRWRG